ncbi:unnamed protein product [marine sediment metagenome]|uniref:Uncharacterized protein n=1 Tax=marine sediment metagenome TaxID=412755 RepID=X0UUR6_9ZZZZ
MDLAGTALIGVNLLAGFGCAVPVARLLGRVQGNPNRVLRYFALLIGVYFVESVAMVVGMGIPVFSVGLAFVWGIVFGRWLRRSGAPVRRVLQTALALSLYCCLPAASFLVIPVLVSWAGWAVLSVADGTRFGIPEAFPWPTNTILGFYATGVAAAVVLKTLITTGEVSFLIHRREGSAVDG